METGGASSHIPAASRAVAESLYAENRACAARLRACHRLYEVCEDEHFDQLFAAGYDPESDDRRDYAVVDPFDVATSEIVAAYGVHLHRARAILNLARDLASKFPAILEAMEAGWLDERTAELLVKQMRYVSMFHRYAVQKDVIDWLREAIESGRRPGRTALVNKTDAIINKHDPEGVAARREAAFGDRGVQLRRGADGMSELRANLSSLEASAIFDLLQNAAREKIAQERAARAEAARNGEDVEHWQGRTPDQHRADALVDALLGTSAADVPDSGAVGDDDDDDDDATDTGTGAGAGTDTRPGTDTDTGTRAGAGAGTDSDTGTGAGAGAGADGQRPSGGSPAPQLRPLITVLAPLGPDDEPEVYLPRGGQASIDALIALLSRSVGAAISVPDTRVGSADTPHGARRYKISTELARRIRLRDGTCRHPGCSVPADDCDIDHLRPFSHNDPDSGGLTVESNLICLCRRHHRFKTFYDWRYHLSRDGTLTVTTNTGHTVTTDPDGPLYRWRQQAAEGGPPGEDPLAESGPVRQPSPFGPNPEPQPTHWLQRAKRLAAERRANIAARHAPPPNRPGGQPQDEPPPF